MKKITLLLSLAIFAFACGDKKVKSDNNEEANTNATEENINAEEINNPSTATDPDAAVDPQNAPQITFEQEKVAVGEITEGEQIEIVFKFTNTGKSNLLISAVEPTCGCTLAGDDAYPKEPVAPGAEGKIKVVYNSQGRGTGAVTKTVEVKSNAPAPNDVKVVSFSLEVNPKQ